MKRITKIKKTVKKKLTSLILFMMFLTMILIVIFVFSVFVPTATIDAYGNRLEGIEEYTLSDEKIDELTDQLMENEAISDCYIRVSGKIIYINMVLNEESSIAEGKNLSNEFIDNFESDIIEFYDFQNFITFKEEVSIGYKTPNLDVFSWTNN